MSKMKIISVLLISAMLFSMLAMVTGCAKTEDGGNDSNFATEKNTGGGEEKTGDDDDETTDSEPDKILPNLDENADFEGYVFTYLTRITNSPDWVDWIVRDCEYLAELDGETINDAVFKRNTYLEGKYNFTLKMPREVEIYSALPKAILAGEDIYDVVFTNLYEGAGLIQKGYFMNLNNIPNLDLSQPWWDRNANESMSVINKLYLTSGDIAIINKDTCPGILFNKKLITELQLEDPYPLVYNDEWTIDKLYEMTRGAARDLNGDGEMKYTDDRYGFIGQRDSIIAFLHGADERIARKDDNDAPYFTISSERVFSAMEKCFDIMYDQTIAHNAHHLDGKVPAVYQVSEQMFMEDRALFMWCRLRIVENLRSMTTDFGILPMPKLDSNQKNWGHTVNKYTGVGMGIPITADDPARTGFILEAICAESKYTTVPAYYDISLKTKMARDEESEDMLDIIFSSTVWDIGEIFNFGEFGWDLAFMSMKNNRDLASRIEKSMTRMERDLAKTLAIYEELD